MHVPSEVFNRCNKTMEAILCQRIYRAHVLQASFNELLDKVDRRLPLVTLETLSLMNVIFGASTAELDREGKFKW